MAQRRVVLGMIGVAFGLILAAAAWRSLSLTRPSALGPRALPAPALSAAQDPRVRALALARYTERRWPRVVVRRVDANRSGTVVVYAVRAAYDTSIENWREYEDHVRELAANLRQASVELLKLTARAFPELRLASVWEDPELVAFWSRAQIESMRDPRAYRDLRAHQRLVVTAAVPPFGLQLAEDQRNRALPPPAGRSRGHEEAAPPSRAPR